MGTIGPTTNHSTGTDDHLLAFEVTSAERSRPGRPSYFPDGKERILMPLIQNPRVSVSRNRGEKFNIKHSFPLRHSRHLPPERRRYCR